LQHFTLPHWGLRRRGWVTSIRREGVQQADGHAPLGRWVTSLQGGSGKAQGKQALRARVKKRLPSKHDLGTGSLPH
jgi:hypothetical protein